MSEELKPCPFCGGTPNGAPEDNGSGSIWIICDNKGCGCEGPYERSVDAAVAAWNRRAALTSAEGSEG